MPPRPRSPSPPSRLPTKLPQRTRKTVRAIDHHAPVRSCLGCRSRRPHSELVRITRASPNGDVSTYAVDGPSSGRGAWLCRGTVEDAFVVVSGCLERALAQRQFGRAWRTTLDDHDVEALRDALRHDEQRTS